MSMPLVFGSVCSGIEAASVAWKPLGWQCRFVSEIDPFPSAVLAYRYPEVPNLGDFTQIGGDAGPIDVLVGGTPCQSFSVAGLRGGLADDRGNLALEFLRLAGRLRPRWVVWENVPGVLSSNGGRDFGAFLGGLVELGYGFAYRVLDAQFFGVPQRRRRVFVVGCAGDWRPAAAVLFERASLSGHPAPRREAGAGAAGGVAKCLRARSQLSHREDADTLIARSLNAHSGRNEGDSETFVAHTLRGDGFDASEDGTGRGTPLVPVVTPIDMRQASRGDKMTNNRREGASGGAPGTGVGEPGDPAPSLSLSHPPAVAFTFDERQITSNVNRTRVGPGLPCGMLHEQPHAIVFQERGREGGRSAEWHYDLSYSLNAPSGGGRRHELNVATAQAVRRLTPRECERLQGFPDDWTLVPYRGRPAADGPRYKAIGNSMAVPVMAWIGRRTEAAETIIAWRSA